MMTKSPSLLLRCFNAFGSTLDSLMTMITSSFAFKYASEVEQRHLFSPEVFSVHYIIFPYRKSKRRKGKKKKARRRKKRKSHEKTFSVLLFCSVHLLRRDSCGPSSSSSFHASRQHVSRLNFIRI